jgi:hypothetical protein
MRLHADTRQLAMFRHAYVMDRHDLRHAGPGSPAAERSSSRKSITPDVVTRRTWRTPATAQHLAHL